MPFTDCDAALVWSRLEFPRCTRSREVVRTTARWTLLPSLNDSIPLARFWGLGAGGLDPWVEVEVEADRIGSACAQTGSLALPEMRDAELCRLQSSGEGQTFEETILMQAECGGLYSVRAGRGFE